MYTCVYIYIYMCMCVYIYVLHKYMHTCKYITRRLPRLSAYTHALTIAIVSAWQAMADRVATQPPSSASALPRGSVSAQ